MRYVVRSVSERHATTAQVVAIDAEHVLEAGRVMQEQGMETITVRDMALNKELTLADFVLAIAVEGPLDDDRR